MKKKSGIILLGISGLLYLTLFFVNREGFYKSIQYFIHIFPKIFWIVLIVFFFIFITNLFLDPKTIEKYLCKNAGIKEWLLVIASGIISMGSIYLWYPLLKELKSMGMRNSLIATFLYNRAVKIPLLPVMVYYFGWKYTAILTFYMILFSVFQGILLELVTD